MNLVEFLLAQFAEDEKEAKYLLDSGYSMYEWGAGKVLADCKAKRQLVEELVEFMEGDYAPWNEDFLRLLALPYADHPDYQKEWAI